MESEKISCPLPIEADAESVALAHGGGGTLSERLFESIFLPAFANPLLAQRHDGAMFELGGLRLAFSTDSYVVRPLQFPGGNIGDLAVNGTVNDLAMCGAEPLYLSAGFILEEGLPLRVLREVVEAMRRAAMRAGVQLVTGDTKVVERGKADGLFVNTAGIGSIREPVGAQYIQPGDAILISGDLGAHGIAIMSVREGLDFESPLKSDTAPLWEPVRALFDAGIPVHCLRDLTRGGLASALHELAIASGMAFEIEEAQVPVSEPVRGACEILGLDPFSVANEGRFVAFLPAERAGQAVRILQSVPVSAGACVAGRVLDGSQAMVYLRSRIGARRILDRISGEQLPRIC